MKRDREHSIKYRWLSVILCIALCAQSGPTQALAVQKDVDVTADVQEQERADGGDGIGHTESGDAQTDDETDRTDGAESDSAGPEADDGGADDESSPKKDEDIEDSDQTDNADGSDDTAYGDGGDGSGDDDADASGDGDASDAPDDIIMPDSPGGVTENNPDTVSENDATPDAVSENTVSSVPENDPGETWRAMVGEAEEAFDRLLADKPLMALLYRTDSYRVRRKADASGAAGDTLEIGQTLYIRGVEITEDDVWYRVQYWLAGAEKEGYVQGCYLAYADEDWLFWEEEYLLPILRFWEEQGDPAYRSQSHAMSLYTADASDIDAFPWSYRGALQSLKSAHPNWTFVPMKTGLDFSNAVSSEMGVKSLIQKTTSNESKGWVGAACPSESGWYYATSPAVAYCMDPRNFLTETYIFQFEQLTFNGSYHTEAAVQTFLNGTFMKGKLADDAAGRTYAQAFYEIGRNRKLSPIHLASRVYQEQGQGTSALISGTYTGYEGYYNFFNVGVGGSSTEEKIRKGLEYAKGQGWNTRYKSLEGGAATIGNNYILKYQDTIYLEKFNVDKNSPYGVYNHQYMQNIQAPASESSSTRKMYESAGSLSSAFVFKIPVYENMPDEQYYPDVTIDRTGMKLRRPDTVVTDTTGLSKVEIAENTAEASLKVLFDESQIVAADKTVAWTTSNAKTATVTADASEPWKAVVRAVGKGEAVITARAVGAGNQTVTCKVSVSAPIIRVELTNPNADAADGSTTLLVGQSVALAAEYWPKDTTSDTTVTWSSSNEKAATVTDGKVSAIGKGRAVITAKTAGCEGGYTASHEIVVEECSVTFMKRDGVTVLKKQPALYGGTIAPADFPAAEAVADSEFTGWYTGENGTGSIFDETTVVYRPGITLYPHYEEQGRGFYVLPVGDQVYTGAAIRPAVRVYDSVTYAGGGRERIDLVYNKDYTVSYKNNKNVNTQGRPQPTIVIKGKGNYSGTAYAYFDIVPKALTDADVTADSITVGYNGRVIKSVPTVYRGGKKLTRNTHYTVTYPQTGTGAYQTAGTYPVVITGKGGYTGRITVYETITTQTLMSKVTIAKVPDQTYRNELVNKGAGIGMMPEALTVTYKKEQLTESTDGGKTGDYTVTYEDNLSVGTATATITAVKGSGFVGSKSVKYKIVGTSIARAKAEGITDKVYTGVESDVQQTHSAYTLSLGGQILTESVDGGVTGDYVVSYTGTSKAGTAYITFQGVNEYTGKLRKSYRITGYQISSGESSADGSDGGVPDSAIRMEYYTQDAPDVRRSIRRLSEIEAPYVKGGSKPVVVLYLNGIELTAGKDYRIQYANHNAVTLPAPGDPAEWAKQKAPRITVTGRGNLRGSITGCYTITDGRIAPPGGKVTMSAKDAVYRNKKGAYKTAVTLTDCNGARLTAGRDYDKNLVYTYAEKTEWTDYDGNVILRNAGDPVGEEDIPGAGTLLRVTAQGTGAYAGDGAAYSAAVYRIVSADIARAKVKAAPKEYLNGQAVTLSESDLTVTASGSPDPLVYGTDYTIDAATYTNHTNKGKASVIMRGLGNYGGEKKVTYTVSPKKLLWWRNLLGG